MVERLKSRLDGCDAGGVVGALHQDPALSSRVHHVCIIRRSESNPMGIPAMQSNLIGLQNYHVGPKDNRQPRPKGRPGFDRQ